MFRTDVYAKLNEFVKGRWFSIFIANFVLGIIVSLITSMFSFGAMQGGIQNLLYAAYTGNAALIFDSISRLATGNLIVSLLSSIVNNTLMAGLIIAIHKAYRSEGSISIGSMFEEIKENGAKLLTTVLAISVIMTLINMVPVIGVLVSIYVGYSLSFTYLLIGDSSSEDAMSAMKDSFALTNGHKWNLFAMEWHYAIRILAGLIPVFLGIFFVEPAPAIAALLMVVGVIAIVVMAIKYVPYVLCIDAIYYEELRLKETEYEV